MINITIPDSVLKLFNPVVIAIIIIVIFVGYFLSNAEKIFKLLSVIWNVIDKYFCTSIDYANRKHIEYYIKSDILKSTKRINKDIEEILPYDVGIKWLKNETRESFFDGNRVVVCVDKNERKHQATIQVIHSYVKSGLFATESSFIDEDICISANLALTRKILLNAYTKGLNDYFKKIARKEINNRKNIDDLLDKMIEIDEIGFFTNIFLYELKDRVNLILGKINNEKFHAETYDFLEFLYNLARRKTGDDSSQLDFMKNYYKVGIIFVAKSLTYINCGEDAYIWRYEKKVVDGTDSIYFYAKDTRDEVLKKIIEKVEKKEHTESIKRILFYANKREKGVQYNGICYRVKANNKVTDNRLEA